jgi:hypothetical protein
MEYICKGGKTFYSRKEMKEWCKRNNRVADVLE